MVWRQVWGVLNLATVNLWVLVCVWAPLVGVTGKCSLANVKGCLTATLGWVNTFVKVLAPRCERGELYGRMFTALPRSAEQAHPPARHTSRVYQKA